MQKISKNHEAFKTIKDIIKTNKYPEYIATDDLQVLTIVAEHNIKIECLLYSFEEDFHQETIQLLQKLKSLANEVYEISNQTYEILSLKNNHIGIVASIQLPKYSFNDFSDKDFLVILDKLEIPGNVGSIYRTLDSIQADGVILVDPISKPNNPKVTAAARGCNLIIPTISCSYEKAQEWLIQSNYTIFLGEPKLGLDYQSYDYKGKIAIVVGNERFGIHEKWYDYPHKKVFIPMVGIQNSLNVSVAASILVYEAYMKRIKK